MYLLKFSVILPLPEIMGLTGGKWVSLWIFGKQYKVGILGCLVRVNSQMFLLIAPLTKASWAKKIYHRIYQQCSLICLYQDSFRRIFLHMVLYCEFVIMTIFPPLSASFMVSECGAFRDCQATVSSFVKFFLHLCLCIFFIPEVTKFTNAARLGLSDKGGNLSDFTWTYSYWLGVLF